jgi:hypothetical protein
VTTIAVEELTEDQFRSYALADNRLAEKAAWDQEILAIGSEGNFAEADSSGIKDCVAYGGSTVMAVSPAPVAGTSGRLISEGLLDGVRFTEIHAIRVPLSRWAQIFHPSGIRTHSAKHI